MNNLKKIAYNCRKETFLIEKKQIATITAREKIELNFHLVGCSVCRLFQQQSIVINEMIKDIFNSTAHETLKLDNDFKTALQSRIDERLLSS